MQLYIANKNYSSWSLRPWVLMRELNIPFDETFAPFTQASNWNEFRDFSPSGTVPCLVVGEHTVWDSMAIVEYLYESYREVWPAAKDARTWARSAAAEMHSGFSALRNQCPMCCGVRVKLHRIDKPLAHDIARIDELFQTGLSRFGGNYLAADHFTAVDAFFAPVAWRVYSFGLPLSDVSAAYCDRLRALPSMQSWYADAIQETWREEAHEADIARAGTLIEDNRLGDATTPEQM